MAVQVPATTEEIAAPLFKLEEGVASSSAGLVCARMAGVKNAVIERATEIVQAVKDRHLVKPLPEILRSSLGLSPLAKDARARKRACGDESCTWARAWVLRRSDTCVIANVVTTIATIVRFCLPLHL